MSSADLVGQLREKSGWRNDVHGELHWLAADEIERLTESYNLAMTSRLEWRRIAEENESRAISIEAETDRIRDLGDLIERGQLTQPRKVGRELKAIATAIRASASTPKGENND